MALYVSNPRGKNGRFKKGAKAKAKAAPRKRRAKAPARRSAARAPNLPARRRRRTAKGREKAVAPRRRRRSTRAPAPRRRRGGRRGTKRTRRAARRANPPRRAHARRGRRRSRNPLTISNPMSGVPILGTALGMIGPALFGAIGVELIGQVTGFLKQYVEIPEMIEPYHFTIGGLILAGVVQLFTFIPAPIRRSIGIGLASAGGSVDWFRYRQASGAYGALELGDGGDWRVESMGDADAFGALELSGLTFSGDADACAQDFSVAEGEAAAQGYGAYVRRFPIKPHLHRPGAEGDQWHWLAHAYGPEDFKKVANMDPARRLAMIKACREACRGVLNHPETFAPPKPRQIAQTFAPPSPGPRERERVYDAFPDTAW